MRHADTIAAIATSPGRAGIGIVRVSGPAVRDIAAAVLGRDLQARVATLSDFLEAESATLDFPEEEIDFLERTGAMKKLGHLRRGVMTLLAEAEQGRILRDGAKVVLIGQPNVGKSSLLNRLAQDEVAIVTEIPGTTRDPLRHELIIEGVPVHVVDTAGLRDATDAVEKIGIQRAWREIDQADLALLIVDATVGITDADLRILSELPARLKKIIIFNKIDITKRSPAEIQAASGIEVWLSAKTGQGLDLLRNALLRSVGWQSTAEGNFIARERHLQALREADASLNRAAGEPGSLELMAEELRLAQQAFANITGKFSADDLLGEIFSRFCIGK